MATHDWQPAAYLIDRSQQEQMIPGFWRHGRYYGEPWAHISEAQPAAEYLFPVDMVSIGSDSKMS